MAYLGVGRAVQRIHKCPYLAPVRSEVAVSVDGAHGPDAVALVVFLAGLFCGEGQAPQCFLQRGRRFEHIGGVLDVRRSSLDVFDEVEAADLRESVLASRQKSCAAKISSLNSPPLQSILHSQQDAATSSAELAAGQ